jgi:nucleoside-diphosphate-sugar epimerase
MALSSGMIVPPGGKVLVSGVNGFVASHIADSLLNLGFTVRGTVRSEEKAAWIKEALTKSNPSVPFEVILVPDITAPNAWDEAVKGVDGIVHVAGDMNFRPDPNVSIIPMVSSVRNLLQTAAKEKSVKRFVFTSSNRAALSPLNNKVFTIEKTFWNEDTIKSAWRPPPYEADRIWDVYAALKAQTEKEIWKFEKEEHPKFIINSVLPSFVTGPIIHPRQPGSTGKWVMDMWNDPSNFAPLQGFGASYYTDSEDVALLHIAALTQEDVKNERLFAFAGPFNFNSWIEVFRKFDPTKPWPADDPAQEHDLSKIDTSREVRLLQRFGQPTWRSFHDSVKRAVVESPQ